MRLVGIGDIHGRSTWKLILNTERWDKAVFIADYFDTHEDISAALQLYNFQEIINFKKATEKEVILLIGNHDHHYFPEVGYSGTSGYQAGAAKSIEFVLNENRDYLQMAYSIDNLLFTHAGVSYSWIDRIVNHDRNIMWPAHTSSDIARFVNDMWKYKPLLFSFTGYRSDTGDDIGQTPIWIRPRSLMADAQQFKKDGIIQIVGHTQQTCIDIKGKATGGKYFFIDTLGSSGEYLIYEDGQFSVGNIKSVKKEAI